MKPTVLFLLIAFFLMGCQSSHENSTTEPNPPGPKPVVLREPKTVADLVNSMQYRTEGSCDSRDLKLHYLATDPVNGETLRVVLFADKSVEFEVIDKSRNGLTTRTDIEGTWSVSGQTIIISDYAAIEISQKSGQFSAQLNVNLTGLITNAPQGSFPIYKHVDFPTPVLNIGMDCLPTMGSRHANMPAPVGWGISDLASSIQYPPTADIIPAAFKFLVYKTEGVCQLKTFKQLYWQAVVRIDDKTETKLRLAFYNDGSVKLSPVDQPNIYIDAGLYWRVSAGKALIARTAGELPDFKVDKILASLDISKSAPAITFASDFSYPESFAGKTMSLEYHDDSAQPGIDGNSCPQESN